MQNLKKFSGENEQTIWREIAADMAQHGEFFEYAAEINQQGQIILFDIDIDLGGGFEGGFTSTHFIAPLTSQSGNFKFSIHDQHWTDQVGKLFGLEDVVIDYPLLDEALIIKTTDSKRLKALLADPTMQQTLLRYENFKLELNPDNEHHPDQDVLQFSLDEALTDIADLQEIYHLVWVIAKQLSSFRPIA